MPDESGLKAITRRFSQSADAPVCYSDFVQVSSAEEEVKVQFYVTVPGAPTPDSGKAEADTRLITTIVLAKGHAARLGRVLLQAATGEAEQP